MNRQENAVNGNLCVLDEAYRLGRITRDEYRARRRYVIGRLSDSNAAAARNAITQQGSVADARSRGGDQPVTVAAPQLMLPSRGPMVWKRLAGLVVLIVVVALVWYLWSTRG